MPSRYRFRRSLAVTGAALVTAVLVLAGASSSQADTVVETIDAVDSPRGGAIVPDGTRAYVANASSGTISEIDTDPGSGTYNEVVATIPTGVPPAVLSTPQKIAVNPAGTRAYVTDSLAGAVRVIGVDPFLSGFRTVIATVPGVGGPFGIVVTPDGTRAYVTHSNVPVVSVIDTDPASSTVHQVAEYIPIGSDPPHGVAVTPDGSRAYVTVPFPNLVSVIDTDPASATFNEVVATIPTDSSPTGIAIVPDGTRAYVAHFIGSVSGALVSVIDTDPASGTFNEVVATIPTAMHPRAIAVTPDATRAYVAHYSSGFVSVIDIDPASSTVNEVVATIPTGNSPFWVGIVPDGTRAYVTNYDSDSVSVIEFGTAPAIATGSLPDGQAGVAYGATVAAAGSPAPTFAVTTGALPPGLDLAGNGVVSGTPTTAGSYAFTVTATNPAGFDTRGYTIVIDAGALSVLLITPERMQVPQGGSVVFDIAGEDAYDNPVIVASGDVVLSSDRHTDVIDGLRVTFPQASPHVITATVGSLSASVTIEVIPTALAATGGGPGGLLVAVVALLGGVALLATRMPIERRSAISRQ